MNISSLTLIKEFYFECVCTFIIPHSRESDKIARRGAYFCTHHVVKVCGC